MAATRCLMRSFTKYKNNYQQLQRINVVQCKLIGKYIIHHHNTLPGYEIDGTNVPTEKPLNEKVIYRFVVWTAAP